MVDLRIYEFTEPVLQHSLPQTGWYNLASHIREGDEVQIAFAAGYPHLDRTIDYEIRDIRLAPRVVYGVYLGATFDELHGLSVEPPLDYDPDGHSGGPVFGLVHSDGQFHMRPLGITTNATRTQFNFVSISAMLGFLETEKQNEP